MPVLPRAVLQLRSRTPQESKIFEGDIFWPMKLNEFEQAYLVDKIGESPMVMDSRPLPVGAHPLAVYTVLDVLRDESKEIQEACREAIAKGRQYVELSKKRFAKTGVKDHPGVGNARGQTKGVFRLNVQLGKRIELDREDWAAELGTAPVVVDAEQEARVQLPCPWCTTIIEETGEANARRELGRHIHFNHKDEKPEWKKDYLPALQDGVEVYLEKTGLTTPMAQAAAEADAQRPAPAGAEG